MKLTATHEPPGNVGGLQLVTRPLRSSHWTRARSAEREFSPSTSTTAMACPRLLLRTFEVARTFLQRVEEPASATNGDLVFDASRFVTGPALRYNGRASPRPCTSESCPEA